MHHLLLAGQEGEDRRFIDSPSTPRFSSHEAYRALSPARPLDTSACLTWSLRIPTKVRIFAYLLDIDRLSTRANLFRKGCAPSSACAACGAPETGCHLFFDCPGAAELWARLDVPILSAASPSGISRIPHSQPPVHVAVRACDHPLVHLEVPE
ncbi:hypothetical protein QYE76_059654 [Lolium multiflorum]|uniref:Reverse transcriptase zinc-binding domain-containing protein n=1 Tax=Lolium multiflorum TaxID=4521 RepID=A0AAD8RXJ6_LOLMU|nr:hypothetical protein QYE76_059654 [Lolium multiflorum]